MPPSHAAIETALRAVVFPGFKRDIVTLGMVREIAVDADQVRISLTPGTDRADVHRALEREIVRVLERLPEVGRVTVEVANRDGGRGRDPSATRAAIPGVRHVIAVASGKGGVGKSTVAVNLAVALAGLGHRVGLLDADVYGPSLPIMAGTMERPRGHGGGRIHPPERHGLRLMSIGFFLDEQSPVMWRGPLVMGIVRQFLRDVEWGALDYLIVDLPPGTGDAVLTLVQQVPLTGAVVVTTPQDVALRDVERGLAMFEQVSTPIIGLVENMAGYACPACGVEDPVFGDDGGARLAASRGTRVLARIPLLSDVRAGGDDGVPFVLAAPGHAAADAFRRLAAAVVAAVDARAEGAHPSPVA